MLYHGSNEKIDKVTFRGEYGGIFASASKDSALSHGAVLHTIDVDDSEIMSQSDIENVDNEDLLSAAHWVKEEDIDSLRELVVGDRSPIDSDVDLMHVSDLSEASIAGQRIRGEIARAKGFKAVEMNDEHGTSYLVLPGAKIHHE